MIFCFTKQTTRNHVAFFFRKEKTWPCHISIPTNYNNNNAITFGLLDLSTHIPLRVTYGDDMRCPYKLYGWKWYTHHKHTTIENASHRCTLFPVYTVQYLVVAVAEIIFLQTSRLDTFTRQRCPKYRRTTGICKCRYRGTGAGTVFIRWYRAKLRRYRYHTRQKKWICRSLAYNY